jgi:branched-chain amino acid aminotransferase
VTGGHGPLGSDRHDSALTHIVTAVPHARPGPHGSVVTVPWVRNERAATAGLKTTSYADNVIALALAKGRGALEAVFANTRGELCEATGSNVFVVVDGVVRTPPLDSGCLAGITRELLLEWCAAAGVEVLQEALALDVLTRADEVFLTSSIKDVFPVSAVDGRGLPTPGPATSRVREVWAARAAEGVDP